MADRFCRNPDEDEEQRQRELHEAAAPFIGSLAGGDPSRSQNVREQLRRKLIGRRGELKSEGGGAGSPDSMVHTSDVILLSCVG